MAANINDKFTKATNGSRPVPTTLTAILPSGASPGTATCGALTGWPTATAVHFIIYTIDVNGRKVSGSQTDWKGIVSGSTITGLVLKAGTNNGYGIGAVVEAAPTAAWADDVTEGLSVSLDQDGTLKAGAVDNAAVLATDVVETAKIKDDAVTSDKIDFPSYVSGKHYGYVKLGSNTTSSSASTVILSLSGTNMIVGGVYQVEATVMGAPNVTVDYDMYIRVNGGTVVENIASVSPSWGSVPLSCQFTYASGDVQLTGNSNGKIIHAAGTTLKYRLVG